MKELQTIVDETRRDPAIDINAFPDMPLDVFWTSTAKVDDPTESWFVSFYEGFTFYRHESAGPGRVRCVR